CLTRFYSNDELRKHCNEKHEQCFICKQNGIRQQYYENFDYLENHFEHDHWKCKEAVCVEKRFVVFNTELELNLHISQNHPTPVYRSIRQQPVSIAELK